eukprot:Skav235733  [mRNA]  locus=scaffold1686:104075:109103:- [translate_table: standard]
MGVANISSLPMQSYPCAYNHDLDAMSRLLENIVHLGNGTHLYVATVYGPTLGPAHSNPWAMLHQLCATAFTHAHAFRGPAVVLGDFNADLEQCPGWKFMLSQGWTDAANFDAIRRGVSPAATCRNATRKTFILINQPLLAALTHCDVVETYDFDSHPLLVADFDLETVASSRQVWNLTTTTDKLFFDTELLQSACDESIGRRGKKYQDAIDRHDLCEAWRQVNLVFDDTIADACVNTDGTTMRLPRGCLGRGRKAVTKTIPASAPVTRRARQGDYTPSIFQAPIAIRRYTRQVRRLHALAGQLQACGRRGCEPKPSSHMLWKTILDSHGYHKGFGNFVMDEFGIFVPTTCPGVEYVHHLYGTMKNFVDREVAAFNRSCIKYRQNEVLKDIKKGGSDTYATVRDPPLPPFHFIESIHEDETFHNFAVVERDLTWADQQLVNQQVEFPNLQMSDIMDADVFTDGSAVFTSSFLTAKGAGGFVCCKGDQVLETKSFLLPGQEQSAYRAEIWAFIIALQRFTKMRVLSDCAAMIAVAQSLTTARNNNSRPSYRDNRDLWGKVWSLLQQRPAGSVTIQKVKAHSDWKNATDQFARWAGKHNDRVDRLAKQCVGRGVAGQKAAIQSYEQQSKHLTAQVHRFFCMWHKMNKRCLIANNHGKVDRFATEPTFELPIVTQRLTQLSCVLADAQLKTCPFGHEFGRRLCAYFHGLSWDYEAGSVSLQELFADFTISTGTTVPVLCHVGVSNRKGPVKTYNLADQSIVADETMQVQSLTELMRAWRKAVKWLLRVWTDNAIGSPDALGKRQLGVVLSANAHDHDELVAGETWMED